MSEARYEFRAFGQSFGIVEEHIRSSATCDQIRESAEVYVVSAKDHLHNTKIRARALDIKVLVRAEQGLEQWSPFLKLDFPLAREDLEQHVLPALGVAPVSLSGRSYTPEAFLGQVRTVRSALAAVRVFKRRFGFSVNGCITEMAELLINGAAIRTAAVESGDPDAVLETCALIGLDAYENVNYQTAIKRMIGMEPLPEAALSAFYKI